jgi:transcriptional regulator
MGSESLTLSASNLNFLILQALARGPLHGFGVARWVKAVTDDALCLEEGSLYPALHRLEKRGLLESLWATSENNRRAKYYRLTASGRRQLEVERENWERLASAMTRIAGARPEEASNA